MKEKKGPRLDDESLVNVCYAFDASSRVPIKYRTVQAKCLGWLRARENTGGANLVEIQASCLVSSRRDKPIDGTTPER